MDDDRFICCEPNLTAVQDISIKKLKQDQDRTIKKVCTDSDWFDVNASKNELIETFSLRSNEYLKCKWDEFLDNVPKTVLVIKPYLEFTKKADPVRRMILTGDFYQRSGKLLPVPRNLYQNK